MRDSVRKSKKVLDDLVEWLIKDYPLVTAAAQMGVPRNTLNRWIKEDEEWQAAVSAARAEARSDCVAAASPRLYLESVMNDEDADSGERLKAATTLYNNAIRRDGYRAGVQAADNEASEREAELRRRIVELQAQGYGITVVTNSGMQAQELLDRRAAEIEGGADLAPVGETREMTFEELTRGDR